jgi:hypothetical protein
MDNQQHQPEEFISNTELSSIYKKISIDPDTDFDAEEIKAMITNNIETAFSKDMLLIESKILITDINKLNQSFVTLIKKCNQDNQYRNVSQIFIVYCDYFDLPYNVCYTRLHEKLQKLIEYGFIKMIGGIEKYTKLKRKLNPTNLVTIFDLIS